MPQTRCCAVLEFAVPTGSSKHPVAARARRQTFTAEETGQVKENCGADFTEAHACRCLPRFAVKNSAVRLSQSPSITDASQSSGLMIGYE